MLIQIQIRNMGGQNCGPLLGPLNTRCRVLPRTQKGTIIVTTIHIGVLVGGLLEVHGTS